MHPADTTPANLRPEPTDSNKVSGGLQVSPRRLKKPSHKNPDRPKILLCYSDVRQGKYEAKSLRERGFEVFEHNTVLEDSSASLCQFLDQVSSVRFDISVTNADVWGKLCLILNYRLLHDMKPSLVCVSNNLDKASKDLLVQILRAEGDACVGNREGIRSQHPPGPLTPFRSGWGIEITHRFWSPGTVCQDGEEVWDVAAFNDHRTHSLPLGTKQKVILDHWAHHTIPQTTSQWAAGLNASSFVQRHGSRSRCRGNFGCRSSRTGMKQHFWRMGEILVAGFKEVGVEIDESRIIERIRVDREVKYRLHPALCVTWKHVEK